MIALAAGYLFKVDLSDSLPFVWCGLILILYMLAFGRNLNLINLLLPLGAIGLTGLVCVKKNISAAKDYVLRNCLSTSALVYIFFSVIVAVGVSSKIVTWWDDVNFWASDLKSIYYLDGFASKYANVSPAFGDYPPGVQLAKWFIASLNPNEFKENLSFVGFYLFNASFLLPLFRKLSKRRDMLLALPLAFLCWILPGIAEIYGYAGFCADLSMALIFGNILISAVDVDEETNPVFDFARISLYLAVLVIVKSTGAIWALLGGFIWCGARMLRKENVTNVILDKFKSLCIFVAPAIVGGSWMLFCLLRRRVTQTTSTMVTYITTDKYGLSDYTKEFARAFIRAFLVEPLHVGRWILNPSPVVMLVFVILSLIVLYKRGYLVGRSGRFVCVALPIVGVLYYCIIFLAHITIFATETQYLESSAMIASIERYGAPFMLGVILFIFWIWINKIPEETDKKLYSHIGIVALVVVLLSNIPAAYDGLVGYRNALDENMRIRNEFVDESSKIFLGEVKSQLPGGNARVCRLRDGGYYRVADTYVAYEASPVSVISISYDMNTVDLSTIITSVNQTHAVYLYADAQDLSEINILDECVSDGAFEFEKLYVVSYEAGGMVLYPVN